jgi:NADH-quinone oxidoreductase subunit C
MNLDAILKLLQDQLKLAAIEPVAHTNPPAIRIPAAHIATVCQYLHENPLCYFDYLACITALDNGPQAGTLEVIYNLYSIPCNKQLMIYVMVPRNQPDGSLPCIPTVSHIWQAANWHEREAYDLVGVHFTGHPDLRRILLPADWEGHPLRQDDVHATHYHGMPID